MKTSHLTTWEQEEYLINQRSPQLLRHLSECPDCRAAVARLENGMGVFRRAAVEWSAESLASRPRPSRIAFARSLPVMALRWALVAVVPLVLLVLALLPFRLSKTPFGRAPELRAQAPQMNDDALLEQVDEQLSVAVPSSMESLTHLVSAQSSSDAGTALRGSKPIVQTN